MKLFRYDKILFEKQSGEQLVQVVQRDDRRELRFGNHITQSATSLENPDFLQLDYTRAMMAAFLFAPKPTRILHIGLGAGSVPRFIHRHFPKVKQQTVEFSPVVIEAAYRYFDLPISPRLEVIEDEGERFLSACQENYHMIFLDAFLADGVPNNLKTVSFFETARGRLERDGWIINNVWGSDKENLNLVKNNLAAVFGQLYSLSVRADSNVIVFAGNTHTAPSMAAVKIWAERFSRTMPIDLMDMVEKLTRVRVPQASTARVTG